jgi:hypothetical protein
MYCCVIRGRVFLCVLTPCIVVWFDAVYNSVLTPCITASNATSHVTELRFARNAPQRVSVRYLMLQAESCIIHSVQSSLDKVSIVAVHSKGTFVVGLH